MDAYSSAVSTSSKKALTECSPILVLYHVPTKLKWPDELRVDTFWVNSLRGVAVSLGRDVGRGLYFALGPNAG